MKHIEINFHFVHDKVFKGSLCVSHISTQDQLIDSLNKPISRWQLLSLQTKIGVLQGHPLLWGHNGDNYGNRDNYGRHYYDATNNGDHYEGNYSATKIPQIKA